MYWCIVQVCHQFSHFDCLLLLVVFAFCCVSCIVHMKFPFFFAKLFVFVYFLWLIPIYKKDITVGMEIYRLQYDFDLQHNYHLSLKSDNCHCSSAYVYMNKLRNNCACVLYMAFNHSLFTLIFFYRIVLSLQIFVLLSNKADKNKKKMQNKNKKKMHAANMCIWIDISLFLYVW